MEFKCLCGCQSRLLVEDRTRAVVMILRRAGCSDSIAIERAEVTRLRDALTRWLDTGLVDEAEGR